MATLTITTNSAQDARIVAAYGAELNLGRDATLAEVRAEIIAHTKAVVLRQEKRAASIAADAGVAPVDLT